MSGLIEGGWILKSASVTSRLQPAVSVCSCEDNPACLNSMWKEGGNLIAASGNWVFIDTAPKFKGGCLFSFWTALLWYIHMPSNSGS